MAEPVIIEIHVEARESDATIEYSAEEWAAMTPLERGLALEDAVDTKIANSGGAGWAILSGASDEDVETTPTVASLLAELDDLRAAVARAEQATTDARRQVAAVRQLHQQYRDVYATPEIGDSCSACNTYEFRVPWPCPTIQALAADVPAAVDRPRIVCLCGSTRFPAAFEAAAKAETLAGRIVVSIGCNLRTDPELAAQDEAEGGAIKRRLDDLHKRKIDLADEVLVLNVGGYIGDSTRSEIAYAQAHGKPVRWLEPTDSPAGEAEVAGHRCPACGSTSWVSVSLDEGWTRRAQCVPCGRVHAPLGPGWRQELDGYGRPVAR